MSNASGFLITQWPAVLVGTACIGRGCFAILGPRSEYPRIGLALEPSSPPPPTSKSPSSSAAPKAGSISPLIYFKGIRELSYGLTILLLQYQGLDEALTTLTLVLAGVRVADGLVIALRGGEGVRYKCIGHFLTGAMMGFWGWKRGQWKEMLGVMHDLRAGGFNPPFNY
ncbi:hypothetical protein CC79DRAFT_1338217 [Sarocladium strictum]